jgi:hypothetical protein
MNLTRIDQAPEYFAPNHDQMQCLRLQGHEAGPAVQLWMGMSILEPGGQTALNPSPIEKHYVVLEGSLTVVSELDGVQTRHILNRFDSCRFAPGESRQIINHTQDVARILLAMPFEPPAA